MSGYLHGGWNFVWAAYGWTFFVLGMYGISLVLRSRRTR